MEMAILHADLLVLSSSFPNEDVLAEVLLWFSWSIFCFQGHDDSTYHTTMFNSWSVANDLVQGQTKVVHLVQWHWSLAPRTKLFFEGG